MSTRHTQSFKMQAVEKALSRAAGVTLKEIVDELGIGSSTLGKWMRDARNNDLECIRDGEILSSRDKKKREKAAGLEPGGQA